MSQTKKVRKKYDPSRNRKRLEPFILNHSYFYHGSVFEGTTPRYGNDKMPLTFVMANTVLKQKQKWSGLVFWFYKPEVGEPYYHHEVIQSDGYISEDQLRQLIKETHSLRTSNVEELVSTGYFVVPNHNTDFSDTVEQVAMLFTAEGAWDYTIMTMATTIRKETSGG